MRKIAYLIAVLMLMACASTKNMEKSQEEKFTEEVVDTVYYTVEVVDTVHVTVTVEDNLAESHCESHEKYNDKTLEVEKPDGTKIKLTSRAGEKSDKEDVLTRQLRECRDSLTVAGKIIEGYRSAVSTKTKTKTKTKSKEGMALERILGFLLGMLCGACLMFSYMYLKYDEHKR